MSKESSAHYVREDTAHYLSEDEIITVTEAVRNFAHISQLATKHPIHIHANSGNRQTLLS